MGACAQSSKTTSSVFLMPSVSGPANRVEVHASYSPNVICVGVGHRLPEGPVYQVFEVL